MARLLQWADSAGLHGRTGIGAVGGSFAEASRYKGELRGKTNPFIQDDERVASPEEGRAELSGGNKRHIDRTDTGSMLYKGSPTDPKFRDWAYELNTG